MFLGVWKDRELKTPKNADRKDCIKWSQCGSESHLQDIHLFSVLQKLILILLLGIIKILWILWMLSCWSTSMGGNVPVSPFTVMPRSCIYMQLIVYLNCLLFMVCVWFFYLPTHVSICRSTYQPICKPSCMFICLPNCLVTCLSLFLHTYLPIHLSTHLSVYQPVFPTVFLPTCPSTWVASNHLFKSRIIL